MLNDVYVRLERVASLSISLGLSLLRLFCRDDECRLLHIYAYLTPYFRVYQHLVYILAFYTVLSRFARHEEQKYVRCDMRFVIHHLNSDTCTL